MWTLVKPFAHLVLVHARRYNDSRWNNSGGSGWQWQPKGYGPMNSWEPNPFQGWYGNNNNGQSAGPTQSWSQRWEEGGGGGGGKLF